MRRPLIIGNWKMKLGRVESLNLARDLKRQLSGVYAGPEVMVCPSMPFFMPVQEVLQGTVVKVGAQDMAYQEPGAFTGGVSGEQLRDLNAAGCILGHSERRQFFGETDDIVAAKIRAAFRVGLQPVVCFGESLDVRAAGKTESFVSQQVQRALEGLEPPQAAALILAYEPIWAIGTGNNAEPSDAESVHRLVRGVLRERFGDEVSENARILYGGSVTPENIEAYMESDEIDGALVGGASLDASDFVRIVRYQE